MKTIDEILDRADERPRRMRELPEVVERLCGVRPSKATVARWAQGLSTGVRLRTLKVGGRRFWTAAALAEFIREGGA